MKPVLHIVCLRKVFHFALVVDRLLSVQVQLAVFLLHSPHRLSRLGPLSLLYATSLCACRVAEVPRTLEAGKSSKTRLKQEVASTGDTQTFVRGVGTFLYVKDWKDRKRNARSGMRRHKERVYLGPGQHPMTVL